MQKFVCLKKGNGYLMKSSNSIDTVTERELKKRYESIFVSGSNLYKLTTFKDCYKIPIHRWYKFTQAFSPNLVRYIVKELKINRESYVLDPFAGVGTTPLTCQEEGIKCLGIEISPLSSFIANTKLYNNYNVKRILQFSKNLTFKQSYDECPLGTELDVDKFLPRNSQQFIYSVFNELKNIQDEPSRNFLLLALISCFEDISFIRKHGSHYRFMNLPNKGVQRNLDFDSMNPREIFLMNLRQMIKDIKMKQNRLSDGGKNKILNKVINKTIFDIDTIYESDFTNIITSPPYLNRNNYIAQQKPELILFEFLNFHEYRDLTKRTLRSHVEAKKQHSGSYSNQYVKEIIKDLANKELSYPTIPEMIEGYFQDLYFSIRNIINKSANNVNFTFIVGNSRWSGIVVPVDTILMSIAEDLGLKPVKIIITRYKGNSPQQMARYGRYPMRESIVQFEK